jgi:hypothetical protein
MSDPLTPSVPSVETEGKGPASGSLDYSGDPITTKIEAPREGGIYDPRPAEDAARRRIAYFLIIILASTVLWIFILLACGKITVGEIKEFAVILGPLVTLVSAATGFYYGTKASRI